MDSVWQVIGAIGLIFAAWTLFQAAVASFQPRDLDTRGQLLGVGLAFGTAAAFVGLLGLQVKAGPAAFAITVGALGGYLVSYLSGYEADYGYAVAKGSAWYLAPVGLSAAIAIYAALDHNDAGLAIGVLAMAASLGVGAGQLIFAWQANSRVRNALDVYLDIPWRFGPQLATAEALPFALPFAPPGAAMPVPGATPVRRAGAALCPNGHPRTADALRFCTTCGAEFAAPAPAFTVAAPAARPAVVAPPASTALCPNGHPLTAAALRFCTVCGVTVRCANGHLIPTANAAFCPECGAQLSP